MNESDWCGKNLKEEKNYKNWSRICTKLIQYCRCTNKPNLKPLLTNKDYKI